MIDTKKWNIDFISEKVIKPMYEDGKFPLELADQIRDVIEKQIPKKAERVGVTQIKCKCGVVIRLNKYCPYCGQRLDWEE